MNLTHENTGRLIEALDQVQQWSDALNEGERAEFRIDHYKVGAVIEPIIDWYDGDGNEVTDDQKREQCLAFLGRWMQRFSPLGKVEKIYGEYEVIAEVRTEDGLTFRATASAPQVCTYVPIVDDDGEPVLVPEVKSVATYTEVTEMVPARERVCPPSFLAGLK